MGRLGLHSLTGRSPLNHLCMCANPPRPSWVVGFGGREGKKKGALLLQPVPCLCLYQAVELNNHLIQCELEVTALKGHTCCDRKQRQQDIACSITGGKWDGAETRKGQPRASRRMQMHWSGCRHACPGADQLCTAHLLGQRPPASVVRTSQHGRDERCFSDKGDINAPAAGLSPGLHKAGQVQDSRERWSDVLAYAGLQLVKWQILDPHRAGQRPEDFSAGTSLRLCASRSLSCPWAWVGSLPSWFVCLGSAAGGLPTARCKSRLHACRSRSQALSNCGGFPLHCCCRRGPA